MNKYHRKQFIIGLIYLLIFVVIINVVYLWLIPEPATCYDNIQNQGEDGIDCGGPCSLCSWQAQKDLEVIFVESINTTDNYFDLIAKIKNPNKKFGAESFSFEFDLYDAQTNLISSQRGEAYILPQETKYIIKQKVLASLGVSNTEFKITDISWQEFIDYEHPELLIKNPDFEQTESISKVSSTVENRSNYDFNKIDIYAVLLDKDSKVVGVGKTEVETVLSKENRYFEIVWFFPINAKIENVDVTAQTNVFLDENFMRRYGGEREKFQEY